MKQQQKKPSHLRRLLQIFSSKIHEGDVVVCKDSRSAYVVKSIAGDVITVQYKKYRHVDITMPLNSVKKAKLLSYIEYDSLGDDNV